MVFLWFTLGFWVEKAFFVLLILGGVRKFVFNDIQELCSLKFVIRLDDLKPAMNKISLISSEASSITVSVTVSTFHAVKRF